MKRKIVIKTSSDSTSILKETNQERVDRINSSRKLGTQIIPNKKKLSHAQQKYIDQKDVNF